MTAVLVLLLLAAAALAVLAAPAIPLWIVLVLLVLVRALGDWGLADGRSPLPPGVLGAAVSLGFLLCLLAPWYRPVPRRTVVTVLAAALWCAFFGLLSGVGAGLGAAAAGEAVRLLSVVAAGAVVVRVPRQDRGRLRTGLLWAVLLPAVYQLVATAVEIPGTFQPDTGRVMGTFSHPNPAGAFFVLGALCSWSVVQRRRSVLAWVTLGAAVAAAITTQNLSAVGALFAAALMMRMSSPGVRPGRRFLEVCLLLAAGAAMLLLPQIQGRLREFRSIDLSATGISADSANSLEWRLINWDRLLEIWAQQPWLGHGLSSTGSTIMPLGSPPHSGPVQLLVETGVLGLATAALGLLVLWLAAWRRRRAGAPGPSLVLGIIVVLLLVGAVDNVLNYAAALYLAAVCLGLGLTDDPGQIGRRRRDPAGVETAGSPAADGGDTAEAPTAPGAVGVAPWLSGVGRHRREPGSS